MFTNENATAIVNEIKSIAARDETMTIDNALDLLMTLVQQREWFAKPRKPGGGRKDGLTKKLIVETLRTALDNNGVAVAQRHYLERLVEMGHLEKVNVATEKRGRPPVEYKLTTKGRSYANLSKN